MPASPPCPAAAPRAPMDVQETSPTRPAADQFPPPLPVEAPPTDSPDTPTAQVLNEIMAMVDVWPDARTPSPASLSPILPSMDEEMHLFLPSCSQTSSPNPRWSPDPRWDPQSLASRSPILPSMGEDMPLFLPSPSPSQMNSPNPPWSPDPQWDAQSCTQSLQLVPPAPNVPSSPGAGANTQADRPNNTYNWPDRDKEDNDEDDLPPEIAKYFDLAAMDSNTEDGVLLTTAEDHTPWTMMMKTTADQDELPAFLVAKMEEDPEALAEALVRRYRRTKTESSVSHTQEAAVAYVDRTPTLDVDDDDDTLILLLTITDLDLYCVTLYTPRQAENLFGSFLPHDRKNPQQCLRFPSVVTPHFPSILYHPDDPCSIYVETTSRERLTWTLQGRHVKSRVLVPVDQREALMTMLTNATTHLSPVDSRTESVWGRPTAVQSDDLVWLIPRIWPPQETTSSEMPPQSGRPPQRLLLPGDLTSKHFKKVNQNYFYRREDVIVYRLVRTDLFSTKVDMANITPTEAELNLFRKAEHPETHTVVPAHLPRLAVMEGDRMVVRAGQYNKTAGYVRAVVHRDGRRVLAIEKTLEPIMGSFVKNADELIYVRDSVVRQHILYFPRHLSVGDQVVAADDSALVGRVLEINDCAMIVYPENGEAVSLVLDKTTLCFMLGDWVEITCGRHSGRSGVILRLRQGGLAHVWDNSGLLIQQDITSLMDGRSSDNMMQVEVNDLEEHEILIPTYNLKFQHADQIELQANHSIETLLNTFQQPTLGQGFNPGDPQYESQLLKNLRQALEREVQQIGPSDKHALRTVSGVHLDALLYTWMAEAMRGGTMFMHREVMIKPRKKINRGPQHFKGQHGSIVGSHIISRKYDKRTYDAAKEKIGIQEALQDRGDIWAVMMMQVKLDMTNNIHEFELQDLWDRKANHPLLTWIHALDAVESAEPHPTTPEAEAEAEADTAWAVVVALLSADAQQAAAAKKAESSGEWLCHPNLIYKRLDVVLDLSGGFHSRFAKKGMDRDGATGFLTPTEALPLNHTHRQWLHARFEPGDWKLRVMAYNLRPQWTMYRHGKQGSRNHCISTVKVRVVIIGPDRLGNKDEMGNYALTIPGQHEFGAEAIKMCFPRPFVNGPQNSILYIRTTNSISFGWYPGRILVWTRLVWREAKYGTPAAEFEIYMSELLRRHEAAAFCKGLREKFWDVGYGRDKYYQNGNNNAIYTITGTTSAFRVADSDDGKQRDKIAQKAVLRASLAAGPSLPHPLRRPATAEGLLFLPRNQTLIQTLVPPLRPPTAEDDAPPLSDLPKLHDWELMGEGNSDAEDDGDVPEIVHSPRKRYTGRASPDKRHRVTRASQWQLWMDAVIPDLVPVFLDAFHRTRGWRNFEVLLVASQRPSCSCGSEGALLKITVVSFTSISDTTLTPCKCASAPLQLLECGLFPCTPTRPTLAVNARLLKFTMKLYVHIASNKTAWTATLDDFLGGLGFKLANKESMRRQFSHSLEWYTHLRHRVDAYIDQTLEATRKYRPTAVADPSGTPPPSTPGSPGSPPTMPLQHQVPASPQRLWCAPPHWRGRPPPSSPTRAQLKKRKRDPTPEPEPNPFPDPPPRTRPRLIHNVTAVSDIKVCVDACFTQKKNKGEPDPPKSHPYTHFVPETESDLMEKYVDAVRSTKPSKRTRKGKRSATVEDDPNVLVVVHSDDEDDGYEHPTLLVPRSILNGCEASFKAADEKWEKASTKLYDNTGLMALLCRHDRVLWLVNMHSAGEKQFYVLLLIKTLFQHLPLNITVGLLYDVACQLECSARKWGFLERYMECLVFAVAVFHVFGHGWPCQLIYHPWKRLGFGFTNGEGCERFWHSISHLIAHLRVSSYHHRLYTLDTQVQHADKANLFRFGKWNKHRALHSAEKHSNAQEILDECGHPLDLLKAEWAKQVKAQTKPLARRTKNMGQKAVEAVFALRDGVKIRKAQVVAAEEAALDAIDGGHQMAIQQSKEHLKKTKEGLHTAEAKLKQKELALGVGDKAQLANLATSNLSWTGWSALHDTKLELKRSFVHMRSPLCQREPGITKLYKDYNIMCEQIATLIQSRRAPRVAVEPQKIDPKTVWQLDVDDGIWQDVGLDNDDNDEAGPQAAPPLWLSSVRSEIQVMLDLSHADEEDAELVKERRLMQVWFAEEWEIVNVAMGRADTEGLCYNLHLRWERLVCLCATWQRSLPRSEDPTCPPWGPTGEKLLSCRLEEQTARRGEDRYTDDIFEYEEEDSNSGEDFQTLDALDTADVYRGMYQVETNDEWDSD
ncbi:hypothetical protein DFH09DRAFT_1067431 [Mycena vulgaris]|nr:hypothetical protein DFH09DRAFT_1067431 [Mycena vulgaris]